MRFRFVAGLAVGALLVIAAIRLRPGGEWSDEDRRVAPYMHAFVRALTAPPRNDDPAPGWQPLASEPVRCATCHGPEGARMEAALEDGTLPRVHGGDPLPRADVARLMTRWVRELNRREGERLGKAIVCLDCHASDPRK